MYFEKICSMIAERFDVDVSILTAETNIIEDLGVDSLDMVDMLMMIEDEFKVTIPDDDAQSFKTIGDVCAFLDKNVK